MDAKIITMAGMLDFFKDDPNSIKKGEQKYKAEYVLDLRIHDFVIMAKVRASMKDKSYNVTRLETSIHARASKIENC